MVLQFDIDPIFINSSQLQTTLKIFTHTILFHRSMCMICPKEAVDSIYYIKIDCDPLDKKIQDLIQHIVENFSKHTYKNLDSYQLNICLSLCKSQKKDTWFGSKEDIIEFENWKIPISVLSPIEKNFSSDDHFLLSKMVQQISSLSERQLPLPGLFLSHIDDLKIDLYQEEEKTTAEQDTIFNNMLKLIKNGPTIPFSI